MEYSVSELEKMRENYRLGTLNVAEVGDNPHFFFKRWLDEAAKSQVKEPNAFVLSTVRNNQPRSRVVLLKGFQDDELIFYTNYNSDKSEELKDSALVGLNFCWLDLQRQLRIEGKVSKLSREQSEKYFHSRPRGSQLGALSSPQSKVLNSREELETIFQEKENEFKGVDKLPLPDYWGGFKIKPHYYEFWQGRENRLHDRIAMRCNNGDWEKLRLAP